jgi:general secretion pathway protein G
MKPKIHRQNGFTLIEMIIVIAIMGILMAVAVPIYQLHIRRANEAVLKEDLYTLRNAIDQYTQDKSKAPQDLNDLVTAGYLRAIPKDPFTNNNTSWQTVQEDTMIAIDQTQPGITDVHSGSSLTATDGTAYSSW